MKFYKEGDLSSFEFWSGAERNADMLTSRELDELESILEREYEDGMSEEEVNDLMRFDFETICDWLGLEYDEDKGEIIRN